MFKIFKKYTIENLPSVVKSEMITTINTEGTEFNSFLLKTLEFLTDLINVLEKENSFIPASVIEYILAFKFTATNLIMLIETERNLINIDVATVGSILINAKSILNAVEKIIELNKIIINDLTTEELLIFLTT